MSALIQTVKSVGQAVPANLMEVVRFALALVAARGRPVDAAAV